MFHGTQHRLLLVVPPYNLHSYRATVSLLDDVPRHLVAVVPLHILLPESPILLCLPGDRKSSHRTTHQVIHSCVAGSCMVKIVTALGSMSSSPGSADPVNQF